MSQLTDWRDAVLGSSLSPTQRLVALVLSTHMNASGGSCFPRVETVAGETGLAYDTARRGLRALDRLGWIERRVDHRGRDRGTRVHYTATIPTTGRESPASQREQGDGESRWSQRPAGLSPHDQRDFRHTTSGRDAPYQEDEQEDEQEVSARARTREADPHRVAAKAMQQRRPSFIDARSVEA